MNKYIQIINLIIILFFLYFISFSNSQQQNSTTKIPNPLIPQLNRCPEPLVYVNFTGRENERTFEDGYQLVGNTSCVLPCPSLIFSNNDWNLFFDTSLYSGSISLFCSLFLIITYSPLVNRKHTKHTVSIFFMLVGIFLMMSTNGRLLWDEQGSFDRICPEKGRYARQSNKDCLAAGIFYQFGCLTTILWWSFLSMDLYFTIKKIQISNKIVVLYWFIINSISILLTFIPLSKKQYGASNFGIGCWVLDIKHQLTFWIILACCLLAGCVFVVLIVYEIYKTSGSVQKKLLLKHYKPIVLIILFIIQFLYMFIFITYVIGHRDDYNGDVTDYVTCLMTNLRILNPALKQNCQLKRSIPTGAMLIFFLFPRLLGLECILFYGFTRGTKRIWLRSYWLNNSCAKRFLSSIQSTKTTSSSGSNNTTNNQLKSYQQHESQIELNEVDNITPGDDEQIVQD